ncbi:minor tail protein [Gordonia phage GMA6]|uniref:JAB domain-containing protein n=1 Tax=Gordonia phage GMA6 TaxID=1647285 RepID=A0A0K0NKW6_9CAUD|nr:minor tail protein [Gordonia phage GMA6]AKL88381.1 hypothetical protein GMA6_100 [Gordonia phage GMA6]
MFIEHVPVDEVHERCGLFLKTPGITTVPHTEAVRPIHYVGEVIELPNRADDTLDNFVIHQSDVDKALKWVGRTHEEVLGFWHTHPSGSLRHPSQADLDSVSLGDKAWWHCVFICETGTMSWYDYYENQHDFKDSWGDDVPWRLVKLRKKKFLRKRAYSTA